MKHIYIVILVMRVSASWVVIHTGLLLLSPVFLFCSSGAKVQTIEIHAAKGLILSGHYYLDVRTEEEFKKGHVDFENVLNIPYLFNTPEGRVKNPKFMDQVLSVCSKDDRLIVGCQSGVRSVSATTDLLDAEFKHVYNMGGGYKAWVESGLAVKKPDVDGKL